MHGTIGGARSPPFLRSQVVCKGSICCQPSRWTHKAVDATKSHDYHSGVAVGDLKTLQITWTAVSAQLALAVPVVAAEAGPQANGIGWQQWAGAAFPVFVFFIGALEFGKRIVIQQRCKACGGSGLVERGGVLRKCSQCGGFLPWQGWRQFFEANRTPGSGGPLRQPKGQKTILYKVPDVPRDSDSKPETDSGGGGENKI